MPNTNVATAAWQQALMRVRQEPLRVLMQRAAVSGHLLDIAAARLAHQRCFAATMLSMRADHRPTTEPKGDTRRARLATAQQTCEGLMDRQPRTLALRDDAGWGALAEPLLRAITSHS